MRLRLAVDKSRENFVFVMGDGHDGESGCKM